jgi:hypothetical protein
MLRYYVMECFESIRNVPFPLYHSGRLASVVFESTAARTAGCVQRSATYREFSFWTTNDIFLFSFWFPWYGGCLPFMDFVFRKIGCFSQLNLAADIRGSRRDALAGRTVTVLDYNDIRWGVGGGGLLIV